MEYLKRGKLLNDSKGSIKGPVVYWMSRDQRVHDNWALLSAQEHAIKNNLPLYVVFTLNDNFLNAGVRHFGFMLRGLKEVQSELKNYNIPFVLLLGEPGKSLPRFVKENKVSYIFSDFDPLRIKRLWKKEVFENISIRFCDIDAHNIVPCRTVSDKVEFAAHTIRPKINKALPLWLEEFPEIKKMSSSNYFETEIDFEKLICKYDKSVPEVEWIKPGEKNAWAEFEHFITDKIHLYPEKRNDPNEDAQSELSPYLHFGQISAQRIVLEIEKRNIPSQLKEPFLEQIIVRRELSDNFCYYNKNYDSYDGIHQWAKDSHEAHRKDEREFVYSLEQFENAKTHEDLWNASQIQLINTGKMHGYMRMYWCKKILEWSSSVEEAFRIAVYLNDKYELDGRDPNGYTGIAWSLGGVHDRAWFERPVFGKIRYMNKNGCKSKFDIKKYIAQNSKISQNM